MYLTAGGHSSPCGFEIMIYGDSSRLEIHGGTKNYPLGIRELNLWQRIVIFLACLALGYVGIVGFLALGYFFLPSFGFAVFLFVMCFLLFSVPWMVAARELVLLATNFSNRNLARWHGCEHKLVWLYVNGRPRTLNELRGARRVTPFCGSVLPFFHVLVPLLPLSLFLGFLFLESSLFFVTMLPIAAGTILVLVQGPLFLQWLIATAKPTRQQYKEALELAEKIDIVLTLYEVSASETRRIIYI